MSNTYNSVLLKYCNIQYLSYLAYRKAYCRIYVNKCLKSRLCNPS
jgi:hypothetical protein